jgi:hypothetical protein
LAGKNVPVALTGGVFEHSTLVREQFLATLEASHPQATVRERLVEPALGALSLARKSLQRQEF